MAITIYGKAPKIDAALDELVDIESRPIYRAIRVDGKNHPNNRGYKMYTHSESLQDMFGMAEYHLKLQGYSLVDASVEFADGKYYHGEDVYDTPSARMFAKLYFEGNHQPNYEKRLVVGFRNSMDKSMSFGIAIGAEVMVCSNMCISGSGVTLLKKHVGEIREKIIVLATKHLSRAGDEYQKISNLVSELKETDVSNDDAYGMLGRMYGHKIIRANEFTSSVRTFNRPTHSEYGEGTLNTLYQAVTEACGEQPIQKRLHTLSKVTDFVRNESSKMNNRFN